VAFFVTFWKHCHRTDRRAFFRNLAPQELHSRCQQSRGTLSGGYFNEPQSPRSCHSRFAELSQELIMLSESELTAARLCALDPSLAGIRHALAKFTASTFTDVGQSLFVVGHIFGSDRAAGVSANGHGSDELVAISLLLRIAGELTSAANDLFSDGRQYAAAALLRQVVEIEYLAWAFQTRDKDAERWLRSSREDRESYFRPAKLRQASHGKFRSKDYGHHCELGGHPVPGSTLLFDNPGCGQLMLSDLLGHTGRIWDHLVGWGRENSSATSIFIRHCEEMSQRYAEWKSADSLTTLPPPP